MKLQLQLHPQDFAMPVEHSSTTAASPARLGEIGNNVNPDTNSDSTRALPKTSEGHACNGSDLLSRSVQGAHQAIDHLADTAAPPVHRLQESIAAAEEVGSERAVEALDTGEEWAQSMRAAVRENPLGAFVGAFAVGMLVVRLTR